VQRADAPGWRVQRAPRASKAGATRSPASEKSRRRSHRRRTWSAAARRWPTCASRSPSARVTRASMETPLRHDQAIGKPADSSTRRPADGPRRRYEGVSSHERVTPSGGLAWCNTRARASAQPATNSASPFEPGDARRISKTAAARQAPGNFAHPLTFTLRAQVPQPKIRRGQQAPTPKLGGNRP